MGFAMEDRRAEVPIRREVAMTECEYPKKDSRIWGEMKKAGEEWEEKEEETRGKEREEKKKSSRELPGFFSFFLGLFFTWLVIPPVWSRSGARFLSGGGREKRESGTKQEGSLVILPFSTIQTECITEYGFDQVGLPADLQYGSTVVLPVCPRASVMAC
jgi:hypothetical protein